MARYYVGIDVGTGSARAGIFDEHGQRVGLASRAIQTWRPRPDFVEQSSDDIWRACAEAVQAALKEGDVAAGDVRGVGFDATCSLDLGCPADEFSAFCDAHPDRTVVVYANTSAAVKATARRFLRTNLPAR